jgi:hypothetical protein
LEPRLCGERRDLLHAMVGALAWGLTRLAYDDGYPALAGDGVVE